MICCAVATTVRTSAPAMRADVVDREDVRRVGHRDDELAVLPADRDRLVAAGERLADERRDRPSIVAVVEVDELEPDLARERAHELGLGDRALLDEQPAERLAAARLFGERRVELGLGEQAFVDEQRAERRSVRHTAPPPLCANAGVSALSVVGLYRGSHSPRS